MMHRFSYSREHKVELGRLKKMALPEIDTAAADEKGKKRWLFRLGVMIWSKIDHSDGRWGIAYFDVKILRIRVIG